MYQVHKPKSKSQFLSFDHNLSGVQACPHRQQVNKCLEQNYNPPQVDVVFHLFLSKSETLVVNPSGGEIMHYIHIHARINQENTAVLNTALQ